MNKHQLKQARRDQAEKQKKLYGYYPVFTPEKEKKTIRWGAVFLAICLVGLLWFVALTIIDSTLYH